MIPRMWFWKITKIYEININSLTTGANVSIVLSFLFENENFTQVFLWYVSSNIQFHGLVFTAK